MNEICGIGYDFRNKYKYIDETNNLKKILILIKPKIEDYLSGKELISFFKNKLKDKPLIHFSITDYKKDEKGLHFGMVGAINTKEIIIPMRIISDDKLMKNFELMKTMIHEIFHLFIEGEENVRKETEKFILSFDISIKNKLKNIWSV